MAEERRGERKHEFDGFLIFPLMECYRTSCQLCVSENRTEIVKQICLFGGNYCDPDQCCPLLPQNINHLPIESENYIAAFMILVTCLKGSPVQVQHGLQYAA